MKKEKLEYSFSLNNPQTLTRLRGPLLILLFALVAVAYYLNQIEYQQFALSLLALIPAFVFNHFFSQLQKSPRNNIIPLGLDLLTSFFLIFINGGRENPLYLVLLLHIFIAPFYLERAVALLFSILSICSLLILPFSPFHFRPLAIDIFAQIGFPFLPIAIAGIVFWIFSSWLVDEINSLNHLVQRSIKFNHRVDRYRSLGLLTAGICHELGTPLHTIKMRLNQLQSKVSQPVDKEKEKEIEKDLQVLLRNTTKCTESIKKLNRQAHSEDDYEDSSDIERCFPNISLEKAISLFNEDHKQVLSFDCNEVSIENDQIQMSEILYTRCLLELFENAYEAGASQVKISMRRHHQSILLDIQDDGHGMKKEIIKYLGQPFVSSKERGSGLGLYHLINTLEYRGGKLKVIPKEVGAWIQLQLPLSGGAHV